MESWGPAVSGVIGGTLATWLCAAWSKWVPTICNRKRSDILLRQNRAAIWVSNIMFFSGIIAAIFAYTGGYFHDNDWRGFGLGAGFGFSAPLVILPVFAVAGGRDPREAFVAYAISQKSPMIALYGLLIAGAAIFCWALISTFST